MTRHLLRVGIQVGPSEPAEASARVPQDKPASSKTNDLLKKITFVCFSTGGRKGGQSVYTQYKKMYGGEKKAQRGQKAPIIPLPKDYCF